MISKQLISISFVISLLLVGCDRIHSAHVTIDPRTGITEEKIAMSVKEFASKLNFACNPSEKSGYITECGPDREIKVSKKDKEYKVTLFQLWGSSRYFCNVQGRMFEYFSQKFGEANVTLDTNEACDRKDYPFCACFLWKFDL